MSHSKSVRGLPRRFPVATVCALILVFILGGLILRWPHLAEAKNVLTEKDTISQRSDVNVRNTIGLSKHLDALKVGVAKLEERLIRVDDIGPNQQYFYEKESAAGVKVSVLRALGAPKVKAKDSLFLPVRYNVVVEGRFTQVLAFLRGLELGTHHYRLVNFTLQRATSVQSPGEAGGAVVLNLNLELLASS